MSILYMGLFSYLEGTCSLPKQPLLLISVALAQGAGGRRGGGGAARGVCQSLPPVVVPHHQLLP